MKTEDYNYYLPKELIAQTPILNRDEAKLLIVNRYNGEIKHQTFKDIIDYLEADDILVFNNTKVFPARIYGFKEETNAKIEVLLLKEVSPGVWEVLLKPSKRVNVGTKIIFSSKLEGEVLEKKENGLNLIKFSYDGLFLTLLEELGKMPLPPYITQELETKDRYQTVYAKVLGSAAAPTAGLHWTEELLKKVKTKGIKVVYITLHVGLGTFKPVVVEDVLKHKMHEEEYFLDEETATILNNAKKGHKRIIAIGTTTTRCLEANLQKYKEFKATNETTNIFIYPGFKFKAIDALITNFHLPKSTLLMLVSAFASKDIIMKSYAEAIKNKYRFFSFGDAMFIQGDKK